MSIVVPQDVEEMVVREIASGRYQSNDDVLRSAMLALEEVDENNLAIEEAVGRSTGLNAMVDKAGNFVGGWRLGQEQLDNLLRNGNVQ